MSNPNQKRRQIEQLQRIRALMQRHKESAWECPDCGHQPLSSGDPFARCLLYEQADGPCRSCISKLESVDNEYLLFLAPRGLDTKGPAAC
jgi:hypothetical protein